LSENRTLQDQLDGAEKRIVELDGELAATREKLALLEDEKRSLQLAIDQALNETARLTRRLTESENTLTATRAQLGKVEASFAEAYGERGRLSAALNESKEQHQAERTSLRAPKERPSRRRARARKRQPRFTATRRGAASGAAPEAFSFRNAGRKFRVLLSRRVASPRQQYPMRNEGAPFRVQSRR
jgi:chromosome segregation ATPase